MVSFDRSTSPCGVRPSRGLAIRIAALVLVSACTDDRALATDQSSAGEPTEQGPTAYLPVGTNLDQLNYWTPMLPTLDLVRSSDKWLPQNDSTWNTGEPIPLDANGWVTRLPKPGDGLSYTRVNLVLLHDNPAATPNTRYVVLYTGTGSFRTTGDTTLVSNQPGRLVIRSGASGALYLQITETDPAGTGAYVRDLRVVREDLLPRLTAGETFYPAFLAKLAPFGTLRFMDWMNTNEIFDRAGKPITSDPAIRSAPQLGWPARAKVTHMRWSDDSRGVPVEKLVEIANLTGTDPWFNMPINANDEYVRQFAIYVRNNLRPDLKARVELSNEVWNFLFPQSRYAEARALAEWGPDAKWMEWYGKRTAQVGRIWNTVFGEPVTGTGDPGRAIVVYNTQFGWRGLETYGLETPRWRDSANKPVRAADYFDEYAITGYIDGTMNQNSQVAAVTSSWNDADGGYARAIAGLRNQVSTHLAPGYVYHAGKAQQYGLKLVTYESGYGETNPSSQRENQRYTDFLVNVQRRPEMYDLYTANLAAFRNAGGTLFMNFGIIRRPGKYGSWGVLESVTQATSPRYRALSDWGQVNNTATPLAASKTPVQEAGSQ